MDRHTFAAPDVTSQLEDDSLQIWKSGNAAFMRNWPYAYLESMKDDSSIRNRIGVTVLPKGGGPDGRHADILGGFQLYGQQDIEEQERGHRDGEVPHQP